MMDSVRVKQILSEAAGRIGPSGHEADAAAYFAELFRPLVDEVSINAMGCVLAHKKGAGPRVMLSAHIDEIGLMVSRIEDDGCIRLANVGGVDPRILPASRVWVHGREKLFGTIGAIPPHLLSAEDRKKNYKRENLYVDVGMSAERVRELVHVGDIVTFQAEPRELLNGRFASKTMDDRACVTLLLVAAEALRRMQCDADVWFVCSTQEEVGSRGAQTAAFALDPDLAIALDVNHATIPGSRPDTTVALDRLAVSVGPYLQPKLTQRLFDCAKRHHVDVQTEVSPRDTSTDADEIGFSRAGIPTILLDLPLKYMHTTVETIDTNVLLEGGRLVAHFLSELDENWGDDLWI